MQGPLRIGVVLTTHTVANTTPTPDGHAHLLHRMEGTSAAVLIELMSPLPRERRDDQDDDNQPPHRHPPRGVEAHEVGTAARLGPEVVPAPSAASGGFHAVFTVRLLRAGHEVLLLRCRVVAIGLRPERTYG